MRNGRLVKNVIRTLSSELLILTKRHELKYLNEKEKYALSKFENFHVFCDAGVSYGPFSSILEAL